MRRSRFLLLLDTLLFVSILVLIEPHFAGLAVHEWLGLVFIPLMLIHLLFAWPWLSTVVARLAAKGAWRLRINTILNAALFVTFVVTVVSGLMTSFVALPALGIPASNYGNWGTLHDKWCDYLEALVGLHIALNWTWIVGALRRHVLGRPTPKGEAAIFVLEPSEP